MLGNRVTGDMMPIPTKCYRRRRSRLARIVIPGLPHHVTQRGNRRRVAITVSNQKEGAPGYPLGTYTLVYSCKGITVNGN